ncbi:CHAT domain-containing protein [Streptomyces sp. NBC_00690]|uniref:CHAT domain-containing protein n=1 Tax=Streptomyces sp. NBC_00690 TaxID=2975808 RepID=UPI002E288494|nr:CHAT domain-containing protein [Streptomyces sp. NBC_00690]
MATNRAEQAGLSDRERQLLDIAEASSKQAYVTGSEVAWSQAIRAAELMLLVPEFDQANREVLRRAVTRVVFGRYRGCGQQPVHLSAAIDALRKVVESSRVWVDVSHHAFVLATLLNARYDLAPQEDGGDDPDELDEAIALPLSEGTQVARTLHARLLRIRFERTGSMLDLDQAVLTLRAAREAPPEDPERREADRLWFSSLLADALRARADFTGSIEDINEAVYLFDAVARAEREGQHASDQAALGIALLARAQSDGARDADAERAVRELRAAIGMGEESLSHPWWLSNCADALRTWCLALPPGDPTKADRLREAIALHDRVLDMVGEAARERPMYLAARAGTLSELARGTGEPGPRSAAIEAWRRACDAAPSGDPARPGYLGSLSLELWRRNDPVLGDAEAAIENWKAVVDDVAAPAGWRVLAARYCADALTAAGNEIGALGSMTKAVELLPLVATPSLQRGEQEELLTPWQRVPQDAMGLALSLGCERQAVELLDAGRGVLWSHHYGVEAALADLGRVDRDQADHLTALRTDMSRAVRGHSGLRRAGAVRRWAEATERVRAEVPGFSRFLLPAEYDELRAAASDGPVVVMAAGAVGGVALVVTADRPQPQKIELPKLTTEAVDRHTERLVEAWDEIARDPSGPVGAMGIAALADCLDDTLPWLWASAAKPVLDKLSLPACADGVLPRLWWSPVGRLALLPLHAAGIPVVGESVLDRVVPSYTPNLISLLRLQRRRAAWRDTGPEPMLLPVAVPGNPPLVQAVTEARAVAEHLGQHAAPVLLGKEATADAVLRQLAAYDWVHFACHGVRPVGYPSSGDAGGLGLHDRMLRVLELAGARERRGGLAFLSVCWGAGGSSKLPGEAIHPAAALQVAGYEHVISAMWTLQDGSAVNAVKAFYNTLVPEGANGLSAQGAARALHSTVRALRRSHPGSPHIWAPYVHFGL